MAVLFARAENQTNITQLPPLPQRKTEQAAGFDFHIPKGVTLKAGEISQPLGTGWKVALDQGTVMLICIRSSLGAKGIQIANAPGVIDADYRGEIKIVLQNNSNKTFTTKPMERIAQGIIMPIVTPSSAMEVTKLPNTDRGEGGFGSTGQGV